MKNLYKFIFPACAIFFLTGCALPVPVGSELKESGLDKFVSARELFVVSLAREGMQLFNQSRFLEAEARFRKALYLDPTLDNVRFNLATTMERTGLFDEALQIYDDLILKQGDSANLRAARARLLLARQDIDGARLEFMQARDRAVRENDLIMANALTQSIITLDFNSGRLEESLCETRALLNAAPSPELLQQYVNMLLSTGSYSKAQDYLEKSGSNVVPDDSAASLYLRAMIFLSLEKNYEALELSERVLSFPGNTPTVDFDLRTVNCIIRYKRGEPLLEDPNITGFLRILDEAMKSSSLASMYWSPKMIAEVRSMLADPQLLIALEEQSSFGIF